MLTVRSVTRRDALTLALILLIAAFMRLGEPGVVEFLHDEAMLSLMAQDMVKDGQFPVTGIPSSVGVPNPPISVYVMALPYAISDSPLLATMYVAALNVIGVGLLWLLVFRYFGSTPALVAGLVYALNPWALLYSRKIWAQDFHTPFVLLALLLGLYGYCETPPLTPRPPLPQNWGEGEKKTLHLSARMAAQIACLPALIWALQIHFAAWVLLPLYFVILWMGRKNISGQSKIAWALALSVVLAGLTLAPFAIGISRTLAEEPGRITGALDHAGGGSGGLSHSGDALTIVGRLTTGLGLETWVAPQQQNDLLAKVPPQPEIWILAGIATLAGLAIVWTRPYRPLALFVTLWGALPLIIFTLNWTPVYPHYFIASIPAYCLLAGLSVGWLAKHLPPQPFSRVVILSGFSVILLSQGLWWRGLLRYLDRVDTPSGFGAPLHYLMDVHADLAQYDDVLIVSDGQQILYDQEPAIWSVMLRNSASCVRAVQGSGFAVFPAHPFAAVIAPNAPANPVDNLYLSPSPIIFNLRRHEGSYIVNAFEQAPQWAGPAISEIAPVQFDNGVELTGYHLDANRMVLEWHLPGQSRQDYHYFGHFLNASGDKLGQQDDSFWPGRFWCAEDRLITWADASVPDGVTTLRVGMYLLKPDGAFVNDNVLDSAGNRAGQWTDITLQK